ncbi:DHA1 family multidrug resistance protein-like MFS transporter [Yokenella regensburgei]|uniref:DHA1 family multidrug resistance protein-like MFS transporter n=1 Tax=Yokenella regensburgei TaxID=158877 RepID=A0ABX9RWF7_9ENTR|nr:MFS transporter [Yokenella regensburgei]RKR53540.1 DHA1 family multidrug resistance protein-like MFS transporter [Yokenella regensburgei]VFS32297.1 Multidrug resistance protein MdtL [Yokenella regensburgei]
MTRFLFCSFALVLLYPSGIDMYLVGLPRIALDLGASEAQLHIAFSVYLAGMAAAMIFAGRIADSAGRQPVAIVGAIVFVMASVLCSQAQTSTLFLAGRFLQGVGAGSCYVVAFAILRDTLSEQQRAKVLSLINGITCIVPVLAPVIGHLIMLKFPWQSLFYMMAGMGMVVCLLSALVLKETHPGTRQNTSTDNRNTHEPLLQRFFLSRLAITTLSVTVILTFVNVSPVLLMEELGLDRGQYSSVMASTALVSMLVAFSTPFALSLFRQRTLMLTAQVMFAIAAVVLSVASSVTVSLIGFACICAGFSLGFGVTMSQALAPFALRAGVASSLLGVSQVCGSSLWIWLAAVLGINALNMLIGILIGCSIICILLIMLVTPVPATPRYEEIHHQSRS